LQATGQPTQSISTPPTIRRRIENKIRENPQALRRAPA
jgi:hypothetical protein